MNLARRRMADGGLVLCMGLRQARSLDAVMIAGAAGFDSVMTCFSKGLRAPVGSAVSGSKDFIAEARRDRRSRRPLPRGDDDGRVGLRHPV